MPVSGRPTNAALLKITQGCSTAEVKGLQKAARGPAGRAMLGAAVADSGCFLFDSTVPKMINVAERLTNSRTTASRQGVGTAPTLKRGKATSRRVAAWGCGEGVTGLASKTRW